MPGSPTSHLRLLARRSDIGGLTRRVDRSSVRRALSSWSVFEASSAAAFRGVAAPGPVQEAPDPCPFSNFSMPLVVGAPRRLCLAFTAVGRRATRACSTPRDPPTVEESIAVMRCAGDQQSGVRSRALIVLLRRAGLRVSEGLNRAEGDLDQAAAASSSGAARRQVP